MIVGTGDEDQSIDYEKLRKEIGPGPWDSEPDRLEWRHRGVPCLIVRNQWGVLCGYAACPPGHPWHGMSHHDVPASAHGGVNYSDGCSGLICHVPEAGEPDNVWWLGFDCGRIRDLNPAFDVVMKKVAGAKPLPFGVRTYRDIAYVKDQCNHLAEQILAATVGATP